MKKILVTGSNGLLGQKITAHILAAQDAVLIATSRGGDRYPRQSGYTYIDLDITDSEAVHSTIASYRPDAVINTAAITMVDVCEANKESCINLNVNAVANLIAACEQYRVQLVHLSTDFVFDGQNGPYQEGDVVNPLSYYGTSKVMAENLVMKAGCKWAILRTVLVYGVATDMSRSNAVLWAKSSLEKGQPIRVVSDHWRTPTLVEDLASACVLAVNKGATGVFHISGAEGMSILELVLKVADFWKLDKSLVTPIHSSVLNEAPRPPRTGFIIEKASRELGYKPHSFEEGLALIDRQLNARG